MSDAAAYYAAQQVADQLRSQLQTAEATLDAQIKVVGRQTKRIIELEAERDHLQAELTALEERRAAEERINRAQGNAIQDRDRRLRELQAERDRLREILEPFGKAADAEAFSTADSFIRGHCGIRVYHLRNARAATTTKEPADK